MAVGGRREENVAGPGTRILDSRDAGKLPESRRAKACRRRDDDRGKLCRNKSGRAADRAFATRVTRGETGVDDDD